jgi:hypothetical protein
MSVLLEQFIEANPLLSHRACHPFNPSMPKLAVLVGNKSKVAEIHGAKALHSDPNKWKSHMDGKSIADTYTFTESWCGGWTWTKTLDKDLRVYSRQPLACGSRTSSSCM